jgi:hypothetical protein
MRKRVTIEPPRARDKVRPELVTMKEAVSRGGAGSTLPGSTVTQPCTPCGGGYTSGTNVVDDDGIIIGEWRCPGDTRTVYEQMDWESGEEFITHTVPGGRTQMNDRAFYIGHWAGSWGNSNIAGHDTTSADFACSPGQTFEFLGQIAPFGGSWPSTDFNHVNQSWGVQFLGGTLGVDAHIIEEGIIGSHPNESGGDSPNEWLDFDEATFTAPSGSTLFRLQPRIDASLGNQPGNTYLDNLTVTLVEHHDCDKHVEPAGPYGIGTNILTGVSGSGANYDLPTEGAYILWVSVDGLHRTDYTFVPPDGITFATPIESGSQVFVSYRT